MPPPDLPTTSYAVLGMLAIRSWTGYELTQQVRRSLVLCWPKNDSVLYDEPKRLVAKGYAVVSEEPAGRRTRQRYSITPAGRQALRRWLGSPPGDPRLEIEGMLRMLYADSGSVEDLRAAVRTLRDWAVERWTVGRLQLAGYLEPDGGLFPRRRHLNTLFARFYADFFQTVVNWCDLVDAEVANWDRTDGLGLTERSRELLDEMIARPIPSEPARPVTYRRPPAEGGGQLASVG